MGKFFLTDLIWDWGTFNKTFQNLRKTLGEQHYLHCETIVESEYKQTTFMTLPYVLKVESLRSAISIWNGWPSELVSGTILRSCP